MNIFKPEMLQHSLTQIYVEEKWGGVLISSALRLNALLPRCGHLCLTGSLPSYFLSIFNTLLITVAGRWSKFSFPIFSFYQKFSFPIFTHCKSELHGSSTQIPSYYSTNHITCVSGRAVSLKGSKHSLCGLLGLGSLFNITVLGRPCGLSNHFKS